MYDLKRGFYDVMSTLYISIPGPLNFQILQKSAVDYPESHTFITESITLSVMLTHKQCSGLRFGISVLEASLQPLVQNQAVS